MMIQLYEYGISHSYLDTSYGFIQYENWIKKEFDRLNRPERKAEIKKLGHRIALFVEPYCDNYGCRNIATHKIHTNATSTVAYACDCCKNTEVLGVSCKQN